MRLLRMERAHLLHEAGRVRMFGRLDCSEDGGGDSFCVRMDAARKPERGAAGVVAPPGRPRIERGPTEGRGELRKMFQVRLRRRKLPAHDRIPHEGEGQRLDHRSPRPLVTRRNALDRHGPPS